MSFETVINEKTMKNRPITNETLGLDAASFSELSGLRSHNITLDELIDDINKNLLNEYTFLRVLNKYDRATFLSKVPKECYPDIFMKKKIKLSLWLHIMKNIKLYSNYTIYRKGYLGENKGKKNITQQLTNYVVPLWYFEAYEKDVHETLFSIITTRLMVTKPVKRILLYKNTMEEFNLESNQYWESSWQNRDYKFQNDWF
jgi:hypothetical protein